MPTSRAYPVTVRHGRNISGSTLERYRDTFSEKKWNDLYELSKKTFVDETDNLKKNTAGAGLTDND